MRILALQPVSATPPSRRRAPCHLPLHRGGIAERRYFLLAATVPCGAAFPAAAVPFGDAKFHPGRVFPPLGPPAAQKPGEKPERLLSGRRISRHRPFTPCKRKTPLPERTNRQGRFHRRNGVGKRNYHVAWGRDCVFCQRAERLVCGHENSRLLSDSAHYIMPL